MVLHDLFEAFFVEHDVRVVQQAEARLVVGVALLTLQAHVTGAGRRQPARWTRQHSLALRTTITKAAIFHRPAVVAQTLSAQRALREPMAA